MKYVNEFGALTISETEITLTMCFSIYTEIIQLYDAILNKEPSGLGYLFIFNNYDEIDCIKKNIESTLNSVINFRDSIEAIVHCCPVNVFIE